MLARDNRTMMSLEIRAFLCPAKVVVCRGVHRFAAGRSKVFKFNIHAFEGRI